MGYLTPNPSRTHPRRGQGAAPAARAWSCCARTCCRTRPGRGHPRSLLWTPPPVGTEPVTRRAPHLPPDHCLGALWDWRCWQLALPLTAGHPLLPRPGGRGAQHCPGPLPTPAPAWLIQAGDWLCSQCCATKLPGSLIMQKCHNYHITLRAPDDGARAMGAGHGTATRGQANGAHPSPVSTMGSAPRVHASVSPSAL